MSDSMMFMYAFSGIICLSFCFVILLKGGKINLSIASKKLNETMDVIETISVFIKNVLISFGLPKEKINAYTEILIAGIKYATTLTDSETTDEKVLLAMDFMNKIAINMKIALTYDEIIMLKTTFKLSYEFYEYIKNK